MIGYEIADAKIDLVPDCRDDGRFGRVDRASQGLVVEAPQILARAAAASDDDRIVALLVGYALCAYDRSRRALALH